MRHTLLLAALAAGCAAATEPSTVANELVEADRAFAARAAADAAAAFDAMFHDDVTMPVRGGFAIGRDSVVAALRRSIDPATSRVSWTPSRAGISADTRHGFTAGYMTVQHGDSAAIPFKYLAYWIRRDDTWRVVAYKRARAAAAPDSVAMMAPSLPDRLTTRADSGSVDRFRASLDSVERAFSDGAQQIGLNAAFARYGSADAINLGGPNDAMFVVGAEAIGRTVSVGEPATGSSLSWAPDRVIVASSGDLGVTIGTIRVNEADSLGNHRTFPFFTVWRRPSATAAWRYIAE